MPGAGVDELACLSACLLPLPCTCPALHLHSPALDCPALPWTAQPCPALHSPARPSIAAEQPAAPACAVHACAPAAPPANPYTVRPPRSPPRVQFKLTNGEQLRGSFPPEAVLQEVCHYLDTHRTGEAPRAPPGHQNVQSPCPGPEAPRAPPGQGLCTVCRLWQKVLAVAAWAFICCAPGAAWEAPHAALRRVVVRPLPMQECAWLQRSDRTAPAPRPSPLPLLTHRRTHPADGGAPYTLVQPYPKRRFSAADMQQSLQALCLQPRQLLLVEAVGPPIVVDTRTGGGWSLGGLLSSAAGFLNPLAYLGGTAGSQQAQQAQQQQQSDAAAAAAAAAERRLAAGSAGGGASGSSGAAHAARKRPFSTTGGPNVHTLASSGGSMDEGDANKYWNGNSTEFGGGPPPGQQ